MKDMERVSTPSDRLKEAMLASNKRQIDLAQTTGLNHSTISRYLAGSVEPRTKAIIKLAAALNVSEWWLWGYDVPMRRTAEQKKNDALVGVVSKLRNDPDFFEVVTQLAELPAGEYASIKLLISSLRNK